MTSEKKEIDIICVGETLIDFIGSQAEEPIINTKDYHRYLGGSPTNVAMNMARLGAKVEMVASVGQDGFGQYIEERFHETNIATNYLNKVANEPTTVIFVNRTVGTPEFIAMRGADKEIVEDQLPAVLLEHASIYHTSCFALSKQPARDTILSKAEQAYSLGCQLSIDINYAPQIWPDKEEAFNAIKRYCALEPFVKVSQDDMDRLFHVGMNHDEIFTNLHNLGAKLVCLTLGKEGAKLSEAGKTPLELSALKVDKIMDATGAGDAFWSGFLFAKLNHKDNKVAMETALKMAAIKLQNVGRIPDYALVISSILTN